MHAGAVAVADRPGDRAGGLHGPGLRGVRRPGIARLLTVATFQATHTVRMDLITDRAESFYEAFEHRRMQGFRIYPGA